MLQEIILLTGEVEGPHLGDMLRRSNPALTITHAQDADQLQAVCEAPSSQDGKRRMIAFCTSIIVPGQVLALMDAGAYNFHPGPPNYPGTHPASYAIYESATRYGVTAHEMAESVDSGAIIAVDWFEIPPSARFSDLELVAYKALVALFSKLAQRLATDASLLPACGEIWSGTTSTTRDFERMREVTAEMDEEEIKRRFRAFG
jgi:methionyl-tRNA formyltransferase